MKILVTGGSGFIGSNFIRYLLTSPEVSEEISVLNVDKITYAGKGRNIDHMNISENENYTFLEADICDRKTLDEIVSKNKLEIIFNFAAESHVDRSILGSDSFENSNFLGACNVFKSSLKYGVKKIIHISTDEVYGSIDNGSFSEDSRLNPSSPYSATKAAADLSALAFFKTNNLPVIITRSANNFGQYQFPEKILPLFITNLLEGKKAPLMWSEENPGLNIRDWLHVEDNCRAIWYIANKGEVGEIYNIPGENEKTNAEITKIVLNQLNFGEEMINKVPHRKAHDFRYSIKGDKLKKLGFRHLHKNLDGEIRNLIDWYQSNQSWWKPLKEK